MNFFHEFPILTTRGIFVPVAVFILTHYVRTGKRTSVGAFLKLFDIALGGWYIILLHVLCLGLFVYSEVGKDTLEYLFEKRSDERFLHHFGFLVLLQISTIVYALGCWLVPQYEMVDNKRAFLKYAIEPAPSVYRVFGVLPFYILAGSTVQLAHRNIPEICCHWGFLVVVIFFLGLQNKTAKEYENRLPETVRPLQKNLLYWFFAAVVFGLFSAYFLYNTKDFAAVKYYLYSFNWLLTGHVFWLATIWNDVFWRVPENIIAKLKSAAALETLEENRENYPYNNTEREAWYRLLYHSLATILFAAALFFGYLPNLQPVHPLVAVLLGFGFLAVGLGILHFGFMRGQINRAYVLMWTAVLGFSAQKINFLYVIAAVFLISILMVGLRYLRRNQLSDDRKKTLALKESKVLIPYVLALFLGWGIKKLTVNYFEDFFKSPPVYFFILILIVWAGYFFWRLTDFFQNIRSKLNRMKKLRASRSPFFLNLGLKLADFNKNLDTKFKSTSFYQFLRTKNVLKDELTPATSRLAILLISGFIVFQMAFGPNDAPVKLLKSAPVERILLSDGAEKWLFSRLATVEKLDSSRIYPIFIVAGQGGGSRAAYWISHSLLRLDSLSDGRFREHCFAISTISGSSPGTAATLAFWEKNKNVPPNQNWGDFPQKVFEKNFVTSGLAGNFFGDNLRKFGFPGIKDSNFRLQEEEARSIQAGFENESDVRFLDIFSKKICDPENPVLRPFDSVFYLKNNTPRTYLPYFFSNTCHVQTGKRAIVSPFLRDVEHGFMLDALDVISLSDTQNLVISLGQAANLSELFPIVSAVGNISGLQFVDGGYYENYGLTTAFEIYKTLEKVIEKNKNRPGFARFRPVLLAVINSAESANLSCADGPEAFRFMGKNPARPVVAHLQTALNSPFGGHADQVRCRVKTAIESDSKGDYFEIIYQNEDGASVPLTRILTRQNMQTMDKSWEKSAAPIAILKFFN